MSDYDLYRQFIKEKLIITDEYAGDSIRSSDLIFVFERWFENNDVHLKYRMPSRFDIIEKLCELGLTYHSNTQLFKNIILKDDICDDV